MSRYKQEEVLFFTYDLWIGGTQIDMDKKSCIQSIEIKETTRGSDTATITIADPEFVYIEDDIFVQDTKIKIKYGWSSSTYRDTFNGYISFIDPNFPEDGIPTLVITCMDKTHKMNKKKKSNTFKKCTRADVVKKIVAQYGFRCVIDSSYKFTKEETITQSDQTDIEFLQKLAEEEVYPFTARLIGDTFYYVRKGKLKDSVMTLTYKDHPHDLISAKFKINKESKKVEIKSSTVDTSSKKLTKSKGKSESGSEGNADSDVSEDKKRTGYTYDPTSQKWTRIKK